MALRQKAKRTVAEAEDWFQVYGAEEGYEDMMDLLEWDCNMDVVNEHYYEQNMDNNRFRTHVTSTKRLDSRTTLELEIRIFTRSSLEETDQGLFGLIQVDVAASLITKFPISIHLPDFLVKVMRRIWWRLVYKDQWKRWEEYAEERLRKFLKAFRGYYGIEPPVARTKRVSYAPLF